MLLSVREDFPQPWEKLDPGLLSQRCGNVAELNEGTEQCPGLWAEEVELNSMTWTPRPLSQPHSHHSSRNGCMHEGT